MEINRTDKEGLHSLGPSKGSTLCDPFTKHGLHQSQTPSDTHFQALAQVRLTPAETLSDPRPRVEATLHPVLPDDRQRGQCRTCEMISNRSNSLINSEPYRQTRKLRLQTGAAVPRVTELGNSGARI